MTARAPSPPGRATWRLIGSVAVAVTVSYGVLSYSFGVLLVPTERELGWPQAVITGAFSVALGVSAVAGVLVGVALDRYPPRLILAGGAVLGSVYDRPSNRFVAGFIGSPAMNFFSVAVEAGFLVHGPLRLLVEGRLAEGLDGRRAATVGIRPSDFVIADESRGVERLEDADHAEVAVRPDLPDYLGSKQIVEFRLGPGSARTVALVHPRANVALGEPIRLRVDTHAVYLFDADDGRALTQRGLNVPSG